MDKYVIAPPAGSTQNSVGASDRKWKEGHFEKLPNWQEYLAESTGYGIVSGCDPSISGLTVTVGAGIVHLADGTRKEIAETNITLDAADSTNPRIDLVYIDSTGAVAKVTGTAAESPSAPSVPSGGISVCNVTIAANAVTGTVTDVITYLNIPHCKTIGSDDAEVTRYFPSYYKAYQDFMAQKTLDGAEGTLTVATFNVFNQGQLRHAGIRSYYIAARQTLVELMTKAQVIGLQEVETFNISSYAPYTKRFNMENFYADSNMVECDKNISEWSMVNDAGFISGNAMFSTYTLSNKTNAIYSETTSSSEKQGYTHADVTVGDKTVSIYVTHFDYTGTYIAAQITELMSIIASDTAAYKIIMGDFNFNVQTETSKIEQFTSNGFKFVNAGQYKTFSNNTPIDEIAVTTNINILDSGMLSINNIKAYENGGTGKAISDHNPIYARLSFN